MLREASVHVGVKVVLADMLDFLPGLTPVALTVVHSEDHLEPVREAGLSVVQLEVSEMQDETQEAAATSSPDPLTLAGPEDRDIDVS